jgi:hypothetical protein
VYDLSCQGTGPFYQCAGESARRLDESARQEAQVSDDNGDAFLNMNFRASRRLGKAFGTGVDPCAHGACNMSPTLAGKAVVTLTPPVTAPAPVYVAPVFGDTRRRRFGDTRRRAPPVFGDTRRRRFGDTRRRAPPAPTPAPHAHNPHAHTPHHHNPPKFLVG